MIAERLTPQQHRYSLVERPSRGGSLTSSQGSQPKALAENREEDWVMEYEKNISSSQSCLNEWHEMPDLLVRRPPSPDRVDSGMSDGQREYLCSFKK